MHQSLKVIFILTIIEAVYGFIIPRETIFKERPQLPASKWIELRSPAIRFLGAPTFLRIINRGKIPSFIKIVDINNRYIKMIILDLNILFNDLQGISIILKVQREYRTVSMIPIY